MKDTDSTTEKDTEQFQIAAWMWVTAVLMVEFLGITLLFDANAVMRHTGNLSSAVSLGMLAPLILTIATATVGLRYRQLRENFGDLLNRRFSWREAAPLIAVHALTLCAFAWIPSTLAATAVTELTHPYLWLGCWSLLGLSSTSALVHLAIPFRLWRIAFQRVVGSLAIGSAIGALAWGGGVLTSRLWDPLGHFTLTAVATMLGWVEHDIVLDTVHRAVGTHDFHVLIAPQCSGYEGIGLLGVYMIGYAALTRDRLRFPHALLLVPIGIAAVWVGNAVRITLLILIGTHISAGFSFEAFHSNLGWIFFCAIALCLTYAAERATWFNKAIACEPPRTTELAAELGPSPTKAFLLPLMTILAFSMVTGLFSTTFNPYYPAVVLTALLLVWLYRRVYGSLLPSPSFEATGLGILVFAVWIALEPTLEPTDEPAFVSQWIAGAGMGWVVFRIIGSVVVVPIVEELAFRGYLLRRLISRDFTQVSYLHFTWVSFFMSSIAFGALHSRWAAGMFAGLLFAMAQLRRGRIGDAIWAHAVANACIAAAVLYGDYWSLWL